MKKITTALFLAVFSFTSASAEIGVNVGISGNMGVFVATATELDSGTHGTTSGPDEKRSDSEFLGLGWASVFIEKELGSRLIVGVDYVPDALETETKEQSRTSAGDATEKTKTTVSNNIQVDFEDLTTAYIGVKVFDHAYVKVGMMSVDIVTKENLGTGSTYGNTSIDGTLFGMGYNKPFDNGLFVRAEGNYMEFDGASLTSSSGSQKITLDNLDGVSGKLSIGKSF